MLVSSRPWFYLSWFTKQRNVDWPTNMRRDGQERRRRVDEEGRWMEITSKRVVTSWKLGETQRSTTERPANAIIFVVVAVSDPSACPLLISLLFCWFSSWTRQVEASYSLWEDKTNDTQFHERLPYNEACSCCLMVILEWMGHAWGEEKEEEEEEEDKRCRKKGPKLEQ